MVQLTVLDCFPEWCLAFLIYLLSFLITMLLLSDRGNGWSKEEVLKCKIYFISPILWGSEQSYWCRSSSISAEVLSMCPYHDILKSYLLNRVSSVLFRFFECLILFWTITYIVCSCFHIAWPDVGQRGLKKKN